MVHLSSIIGGILALIGLLAVLALVFARIAEKKGNTVTVNGSATGGAGNYTYAVFYKQKAQTQWTTKQDFNENTNVSIKPMLATDYDICVKVKDKNGTIAKQYFTVTVTK